MRILSKLFSSSKRRRNVGITQIDVTSIDNDNTTSITLHTVSDCRVINTHSSKEEPTFSIRCGDTEVGIIKYCPIDGKWKLTPSKGFTMTDDYLKKVRKRLDRAAEEYAAELWCSDVVSNWPISL